MREVSLSKVSIVKYNTKNLNIKVSSTPQIAIKWQGCQTLQGFKGAKNANSQMCSILDNSNQVI